VRSSSVRRARGPRALLGALAGLALVLTLAGCGSTGGVAAVADDRTIPVSELHQAVTELGPVYQGATLPSVLTALIVEPTFIGVATKYGAGVSDTQAVDSLKKAYTAQKLTPPASFGPGAIAVARFSLAVTALNALPKASEALSEAEALVQKLHVDVNPRFGKLDFTTGTIKPSAYPWILTGSAAGS